MITKNTMTPEELKTESINFQWDFFERAINNYSIIMRILGCIEEEGGLITGMPQVFVEESLFDMCKIMREEGGLVKEGLFTIEDSLADISLESTKSLNEGLISPSVVRDAFGYGTLYCYPLREDVTVLGYLILGKRLPLAMDSKLLRELEIVCDIYNKALLLQQNVHNQKRQAQASSLYARVVNDFPDPLILVDRNGFISFVNAKAKNQFEGKKGLIIGEKLEHIVSGLAPDFYRAQGMVTGEVSYRSADTFKVLRMESYPIRDRNRVLYRGVVLKDVLENKVETEEHLLKVKMDSIGMLAGGIAHDFNNLLTGVLGYASLIKNFLSNDKKLFRYAEAIEHSAQRAATLTQHLLNFSRRQRKATGTVNLAGLLEDILFLMKESFRDLDIDVNLDRTIPSMRGDEADLQNAILNLCMNAKDAMEGHGTLTVRMERIQYARGREYALVEIGDTGHGIDDEIRARIFEPYFSTKETGSNLGLGLFLVDKVVKEHGGFIEVESEKERGTKFGVYLPLPMEMIERESKPLEVVGASIAPRQKVLIVDDEDVVRNFLSGVLEDKGLEIYEATNGADAVDLFKRNHNTIDLVILDMIMPGMKGDEVLKEIRRHRPEAKVIICSGFMTEEQRDRLRELRIEGFLDKPFRDKELLETVANILSH
jgi:signal transduction histidine kinase